MAKTLKHDLAVVTQLMKGPADDAASDWLYAGSGSIDLLDTRFAISAIEAAVRMKRGDRVGSALAEASDKDVRKFAAAAAHRLRSTGVDVPTPVAPTQWTLATEVKEAQPPVTLLGYPDPEGWFPFMVMSFGAEETVAFAGLAGAGFGQKDCYHSHVGRSDAKKLVYDARRGHDLHELPPHVALHFLDRAFDEGGNRPHEWAHFADLVGPGVITSARLLDPMRDHAQVLDEAALRNVEPLLDRRHQLLFGLTEEVGAAAVGELVGALQSALELNDDTRAARLKSVLDAAADQALTEESRRAWALALDLTARIAVDRGDGDLALSARHTALAIRAGKAGHEVPFVRASVERQLAHVTEAVQRGLKSRQDADPASLA